MIRITITIIIIIIIVIAIIIIIIVIICIIGTERLEQPPRLAPCPAPREERLASDSLGPLEFGYIIAKTAPRGPP